MWIYCYYTEKFVHFGRWTVRLFFRSLESDQTVFTEFDSEPSEQDIIDHGLKIQATLNG